MIVSARDQILKNFKIKKASFFGTSCSICRGQVKQEKMLKYFNEYFCLQCIPNHDIITAIKYLISKNYSGDLKLYFSDLLYDTSLVCRNCKLQIKGEVYKIHKHQYDKDCFVSIAGEEFL